VNVEGRVSFSNKHHTTIESGVATPGVTKLPVTTELEAEQDIGGGAFRQTAFSGIFYGFSAFSAMTVSRSVFCLHIGNFVPGTRDVQLIVRRVSDLVTGCRDPAV